jgi:Tol biopolymer transport system component
VRTLTEGAQAFDTDPAWSPDGSLIAFRRKFPDGSDGIYTMAANGSGVRRLTDARFGDYDPTFSPDATQIAFKSGRDGPSGDPGKDSAVFVMRADGSGERRLSDGPAGTVPAWSRR